MKYLYFPLLLLAFATMNLPAVFAAGSAPPNIVFILADDHGWQAISAYGDSRHLIETPNIDRIAKEGMRFDRCLVTNSICGPARATILTGKYSHLNGFYNNVNCHFDGSQVTFPKLLQKAGYQTFLAGKWHLASDQTGFDKWDILQGQGTYYNPLLICNGKVTKNTGYATDLVTDHALDMLEQRDKNKPFLLMCHHKATHRAWEPPLDGLDFEEARQYAEPNTLFDDYAGRGSAERDQKMTIAKSMMGYDTKLTAPTVMNTEQRATWDEHYNPRIKSFKAEKPQGKDLVRWKYQRYLHDYLSCVKSVDDNVGRVLKYLDDQGLAENTIVVYSSDQGFFLGEHGWFDKRFIFEESLRTPLVVRWPAKVAAGTTNHDIVSNVDFAETFLEAAHVAVPADMQGRSLLPLLEGNTPTDWRQAFYYHYYEFPEPHNVSPHYGIVTDRYKLIHFYDNGVADYWELFDREKDPQELRSFWGEPEYADAQQKLTAQLADLRRTLKVPERDPAGTHGD